MEYFLRCESKETMLDALKFAGILVEVTYAADDEFPATTQLEPAEGYTVPFIGEVRRPTGATETVEIDGESFEQDVYEAVTGYHVNVLGDLTPDQQALLPIIPRPNNPVCLFWT